MKRLKSMLNFLKLIKLARTFKIHLTLKSSWKTVWKSFNNNADPDGVAVFFYFPTMSCSSCLFPHSLHRCVHTRWEWRCIFHIKKKWRLRKIAPMRAEYIYKRVFRLLIDLLSSRYEHGLLLKMNVKKNVTDITRGKFYVHRLSSHVLCITYISRFTTIV